MRKLTTLLTASSVFLTLAACGTKDSEPTSTPTIPAKLETTSGEAESVFETVSETASQEIIASEEATKAPVESDLELDSSTLQVSESTESVSDSSNVTELESEMQEAEQALSENELTQTATNSLVVYFSWSGNTRNVAQSIQAQTGSDIFEIVPLIPYSDDYNTVVAYAKTEQQENARPEIAGTIDNLDQYDTIYVGFPNWWGDMPMILYTFFDTYDLSGKTVALFCTSGGSGLSNTVNEVKAFEPNATVMDGLHIGSSAASNPDEAVRQWLSAIGTVQ